MQADSSLKRSDEEVALLDSYASIKSPLVSTIIDDFIGVEYMVSYTFMISITYLDWSYLFWNSCISYLQSLQSLFLCGLGDASVDYSILWVLDELA